MSRRLRILHVTPYSADAWAYGGIPRVADALTRALSRRGHHVTVCTTDARDRSARLAGTDGVGDRLRAWQPTRSGDGVELRVFPNVSNRLAYHLQVFLPLGLNSYLQRHAGAFDIAHLHACRNFPGAIAARHLRRAGVPYVLAPNGTAPRIERRLLAKRAYDAMLGNRMVRGASGVLAVAGAERQQLREIGIGADRIRLIPNPIDLTEFRASPERGCFRRRFALPEGPLVLFLGKLTPRKRLDVVIRGFAQLERRDAMLVIAGNDMGAGCAAQRLVRELGIAQRTVFTGLLPGRARLEALADADVLVYPSQHEIFGLVPLEALLCGTPVIVAGDSGCGEVVGHVGGGQIIPPGDADALARAIGRVLDAPEAWRTAADEAAGRIRDSYGPDAVSAQVEELYLEVVAGAMRTPR